MNERQPGSGLLPCGPSTGEEARAAVRFLILALAAGAVIMACSWIGRGLPKGSVGRIALALLAGGASTAVIVGMVRSLRRLDELQRKIQLEALAFSFACTGALATAYGFLVNAGLPEIDWGELMWPAMVVLWVIGLVIANRRYR